MKFERTLPPVGYRFPVGHLVVAACQAVGRRGNREVFEREFAQFLGVRHAFAVSSGKAALTIILRALAQRTGRRKVVIPAYTCYSVPSAIVKAGLDVVPCDVARDSFDYDYDRLQPMLEPDVLCVLSVHLFGIPSDAKRLSALCRAKGIPVVEDAAQAMGGLRDGDQGGSRGDVTLFSLGRGKNITCGSGGVIATDSASIARSIRAIVDQQVSNGLPHAARTFMTLLLLSIFISPRAYWFPAGLPFLRLGETIFDTSFPIRNLSVFQAALLRGWQRDLAALNTVRRSNGEFYAQHLGGGRIFESRIAYLRFPVVLPDEESRTRLLREQNGTALGISGMYPSAVDGIPELRGAIRGGPFPQAERLARGLITLPTHPLLSPIDRDRICVLVNLALQDRLPPALAS